MNTSSESASPDTSAKSAVAPTAFHDTPGYLACDVASGRLSATEAWALTQTALAAQHGHVRPDLVFEMRARYDLEAAVVERRPVEGE